jgi:3'-5' exonuclease
MLWEDVLFLNISTAPLVYNYDDLESLARQLWEEKCQHLREPDSPRHHYAKAGIYAEFGKVICISVGFVKETGNGKILRVKSFYGDDEKQILTGFSELLSRNFNKKNNLLAAHNGKEFDFPFLCRRLAVNGLPFPAILNLSGMKSWNVPHLDTLDLWRFGDYKHYTSLALLAHVLGIPADSDRLEGKDIARMYWEKQNWQPILHTCQTDVVLTAQVLLRLRGEALIEDKAVSFVE